jgi:ankyrin repeat protein
MSHLHFAARRGLLEETRLALEAGDPINEGVRRLQKTALHFAADEGFLDVVKLLLEKGADPNVRDRHGSTPLHQAAGGGFLDIVKVLIEAGAEVDAKDGIGGTPALLAASSGYGETARYLLERGADPTVSDDMESVQGWIDIGGIQAKMPSLQHTYGDEDVAFVRQLMATAASPEEFAAKNGRSMCFNFGPPERLPDPEADAWAKRLTQILQSPELLAECEDRLLTGEELADAHRQRAKRARWAARSQERDARRCANC